MAKFNKASFTAWACSQLRLTQEDAGRLYNEIGAEIARSLASGDSANVFGQGILQVEKRRDSDVLRVAYRPPLHLKPGAIVVDPKE